MAALIGKTFAKHELKGEIEQLAKKEGPDIAAAALSHSNQHTSSHDQHTSLHDDAPDQTTTQSSAHAPAQLSGSGNELTTEQREEAVEQFVTQMTDKFVNVIVPGLSNLPANLAIQHQFAEFVRGELNNADNKEKLRNTLSNSISDVLKNAGENGSALLLLSILKNASLNEPNQIKNGLFPKLFNLVRVDNTNFSENFTTAISQFLNNSDKIKSFVEGSTSITVLPEGGFFNGGKRRHTKKKSRKLLQKSIILRKKSRKMNKKKGRKVGKSRKIRSKKMVGGNPNAAALFSELPMADVEPPIKTVQDINNDHITATENINSAKAAELKKIQDTAAYGANKLKPVTQALSKTASVGYNVFEKGASVGTNILGNGASMLHQGVKSLSNHQFTNPDPYSSNGGNSSAGSSNLCESQSQDFIREFFAHITNKQSDMSDMLVRSLINALGDVVKNNSTGLMNEITSIFGQINNNLQQQMGQKAFMILILNLINSQGELFVDSIADTFNAKPAVELPAYVKTQEFSDKVYENFVKKLSKMVETTK